MMDALQYSIELQLCHIILQKEDMIKNGGELGPQEAMNEM